MGYTDVVTTLLDLGVEVNRPNVNGETPLHLAAICGHRDVVQLLLDNGADHNVVNKCGLTPLQEANKRGYFGKKGVVQLLRRKSKRNIVQASANKRE